MTHLFLTARKYFHSDPVFFFAQLCVLLIVISMTKAFALVSFLEAILIVTVIASSKLRIKIFEAVRDPRVMLVMLFWLWILVACLWGSASFFERAEEWWSWRKLVLVPIVFALFQSKDAKVLFMCVVVAIGAIYMVLSWLGYFGVIHLDRDPRELLENHATQGVFFSASTLMAVLLAVRIKSNVFCFVLILLSIGFVLNILVILTGRSGYLSLISSFAVIGLLVPSRLRVGLVVSLVLLSLAFLFVSPTPSARIKQAFSEMQTAQDPSVNYTSLGIRVVFWTNTVEMISQKPLLGSGSGSYRYDYATVVSGDSSWRGILSDNPHQQYLHIWAEQGLIGLLIFLSALFVWFRSMWSRPIDIYLIGGLGVFLGCVANGFANGHFSSFVEGRLVWISMAVLFSPVISSPLCRLSAVTSNQSNLKKDTCQKV